MLKSFSLAFLSTILMLLSLSSYAQVSITELDPGPYTPGSSIAVRISLPTGSCLDKSNKFTLYLSDANGSFATQTAIGTNSGLNFNGSFATFINAVIPASTPAGIGYKVRVVTSSPASTGTGSAAFSIIPGAAVTAAASTTPQLATSPEPVFGNCIGQPSSSFYFLSGSTNAVTTSLRLINDNTGNNEAYTTDLDANGSVTAISTTDFTVFVKATGALSVGTKAYVLVNNVTKAIFGSQAQAPVCLQTANGATTAAALFVTDINSLQSNYPGMLYTINWGDGSSNTYTFCDIKALNGNFSHNYSQSSCGKANNAYSVSFAATLPFCNTIAPIVTSQAVLAPPSNSLTGPNNVCTGTAATWKNTSSPGQSQNGSGTNCTDASARYSWLVDGVVKVSGTAAGSNFSWTFTTHGNHTIAIHYDNSNTASCTPADKVINVCVQDAPVAKFNLSTNTVCNPGPVTITDASTIDAVCNNNYTYSYTVTPNTGFGMGGGTTLASHSPVLNFITAGKYVVKLQVTPPTGATCPSNVYVDTIYVNGPPVAQLSPDFSVCGTNKTFLFDATAGSKTQTTLTGTFQTLPTTYQWTVTGGAYVYDAGSATSKYPTITFKDFGTYTVSVTQTNGCSVSTSAPQHITFQNAPTITATVPILPICPGSVATVSAALSNSSTATNPPQWTTSGTGTFSDPQSFNSSYTPSAADIAAGSVMLTITQNTTLVGSCATVSDSKQLKIFPVNTITSPATASVCNGNPFNYNITSSVTGSTYTWTATGSVNAAGFASTGSGSSITDQLSSTTPTTNATVTYTITPHANGCDGTPFTLTVTIAAAPSLTATPANTTLCSNSPAGISLSSNVAAATMTWTATASASTLTGFTQHTTASQETQISDVLVNTGTAAATVTYTIVVHNGDCISQQVVTLTVQPQLTITANAPTKVCSGSPAAVVLTSNLNTTFYTWTATASAANITGFVSNSTPSGSGQIQDVLVNNGTAPGTVTYVITPTANGCTGNQITKVITISPIPTLTATAANPGVCSNNTIAINLASNIPSATYTWTVTGATADISGYSQPTTGVSTNTIADRLVNKGTAPVTITYTITAHNDGCDSQPVTVDITIQPELRVTGSAPSSVCSGDVSNINLSANLSGITYTWTATASDPSLSGFSGNTTPTTTGQIQQLLINNGTAVASVTYVITPHGVSCDGTPLTYIIAVAPLPNMTATPLTQVICNGSSTAINLTSNLTTTKYTWTATASANTIKGFSSQNTPVATTSIQQVLTNTGTAPATVTYTITSLNGATAYNCTGNSATVTVTVQPATVPANAGADERICGQTSYKLKGNDLGEGATGLWTVTSGQTGVSFADATAYNTTANGLVPGQTYTFRWTSKGAVPCADSFDEVVIEDQVTDIKAAFTTDHNVGCNKLEVTFTNTTTPETGVKYLWNFGNGVTSTLKAPPAQTYITQSNGKDSVYTVTLKVSNDCAVNTYTQVITVKPSKIIAAISPDKTLTCAPFTLNVENLSPGTNQTYTFFLTDAAGTLLNKLVKTDKTDAQFAIPKPGNYKVYMVAQSECGTALTPTFTITATADNAFPRLLVNGTEGTGCVPLTVTFHNNSTGVTGYRYDWGDGTSNLVTTSSGVVTHTFTKGGTYAVVLHASNGCTADAAAAPITINVLYQPTVAFTPDIATGCKSLKVHFRNATTDPSTSELQDLKYDWDFGDGSPHSSEINPTHVYDYKHSPYTVTLTATNATGCPATLSKEQLIVVHSSAITDFVARPDSVINIPDYHFAFNDLSTGDPVSWKWNFGDGSTSTQRNPEHTYADTGLYKVTLTASNIYCDSTKVHYVRITGVPGQVYLPNAFMPNSIHEDLRTFNIKGSGLKAWRLQIFNNYGQLLWETTKLDEKGRPTESWDGTFNGQPLPQGVYVWQATGTFINGNEWKGMSYNGSPPKHTGVIHLLK
ncbi:PKD-like domain-containing protein [Mucilaginibacter ginkgonis]|uniref:PKD domain-containing protein n=1 Tax=Mucilaginibacter ginkgonis TaxID=2682091 RepID=A0A6I4I1P9_9SPHI|nr:PKD-like domain-containing protein [Mucilaginibacter ginkgonis]QQL50898.1 PKD domain-containing protein [Mucilaginibacter ginkgonis]